MANWFDEDGGADLPGNGDQGASDGYGGPALSGQIDWGFGAEEPVARAEPKREKSMAELLYPGYDAPEPDPQPKAQDWGVPKREKSMAELLYPSHYPKDSGEGGWSVPGELYPSHRQNPLAAAGATAGNGNAKALEGASDGRAAAPGVPGGGALEELGKMFEVKDAEAGQYVHYNPYPADAPYNEKLDHVTRIVCKESGGLKPKSKYNGANPNNRDSWLPESYEALQEGRSRLAVVAMRNPYVDKYQGPDGREEYGSVWDDCRSAAEKGMELEKTIPKEVQHFYMAKEGVPVPERFRWAQDDSLYETFGPFRSYGGDVNGGDNAMIRIHMKKLSRGRR